MQRVHDNKPYRNSDVTKNVLRDKRAKDVTTKFLTSKGFTITDDGERYSKYDLAVSHPIIGEVKIECEDRLIRDWTNMVQRRFPDFRIYKRKINEIAEWQLYIASCGDCQDRILVTTYNDISGSEERQITNCGWGKLEPVYQVPHNKWVCFNLKTRMIEWGDNPAVLEILGC